MFYELQPLRLQAGWKIEFNNFTEYDTDLHGENALHELCEDLLRLYNEKVNLIIDLGWYPGCDISGHYVLELIKDFKWDYPLERISTKSKKEIIAYIEKWVCFEFFAKYCNK